VLVSVKPAAAATPNALIETRQANNVFMSLSSIYKDIESQGRFSGLTLNLPIIAAPKQVGKR
jgi:hypothetical protein